MSVCSCLLQTIGLNLWLHKKEDKGWIFIDLVTAFTKFGCLGDEIFAK